MRKSVLLCSCLLLAACGGSGTRVASTGAPSAGMPPQRMGTIGVPPTRPAPPQVQQGSDALAPKVMQIPGLEGVIGANARDLQRQFGTARLDVYEGDARKLQFIGEACVLDVYLYPLSRGAEPTATYVDARRSSDALDVDRAACVAALRGQ
ncbi:hypothetical protein WAB17_05835 [Parerythrobacter aurantius]|uniref:hypothetical protein n=1 Tax=Parerythrobacter aurantius TaxID=3127706 RepID=UPI00324AA81B